MMPRRESGLQIRGLDVTESHACNERKMRVSLVTLPSSQVAQQQAATVAGSSGSAAAASNGIERQENATSGSGGGSPGCSPPVGGDRICFNYGKELYVYAYRGVKKASDLSKPIDKKLYKGTNPSCHDFNATNATYEGAPLLVGFSTGQIQLVYPGRREQGKLYNEERLIDKTKVTCLKWIPGSEHQFLASHASGCMYMYNEELQCTPTTPSYQPYKCGDGYIVLACKSKSTRNPLYKWCFGQQENASINEFCFSPCGQHLAIVSQDGFLRVLHYSNMELIGIARSYFGGFLCVCWSPDGKYVVVGGEDDLVTVYSLQEQRVVARGQGHRSWVSVVSFDPYTTSYSNWESADFSDDDNPINDGYKNCYSRTTHSNSEATATAVRRPPSTYRNSVSTSDKLATSYRLGSVSQDTQLCLWDITEDVLRQSIGRLSRNLSSADPALCNTKSEFSNSANNSNSGQQASSQKDAAKTIAKTASMNDNDTNKRGGDPTGTGNSIVSSYDPMKLIGTPACPRFDDCPVLEPLVCKKIAHERLTALIFREDCFLTACQDGFVYTWARPGYINLPQHLPPSPTAPPGGTVV
ncbi:hypothetical protein quinque_013835 [Culex quinquefasciatus]